MKIRYEYVNETVEIEVDEKWAAVLEELDREERNNEQTETRRHTSHSHGDDGAWMIEDEDPEETIIKMIDCRAELEKVYESLNDSQKKLIKALFEEGMSHEEYAARTGVERSAVTHQLQTIRNKLKKLF